MKLAIYCPTYHRPQSIYPLIANVSGNTKNDWHLYLGIEQDDHTYDDLKIPNVRVTIIRNEGTPGYSDTLQTLYEHSDEPYFFPANDDFEFLPDWDDEPIKRMEAEREIMVLGLSDGNPGGNNSTINMVRRSYIENQSGVIDMPNRVLYPYRHNYSDTEFYETARKRGVWDKHEGPAIIHHHPGFAALRGKQPWTDETYDKNNATAGLDAETYSQRRGLFS